jgi:hypothetical protein
VLLSSVLALQCGQKLNPFSPLSPSFRNCPGYDGPPLALIVVVCRPATAHLRTYSKASMTAGPYPPLDARTIRSEEDRSALRRMIELCRQDTEVAFRPGLEPENAAVRRCGTER